MLSDEFEELVAEVQVGVLRRGKYVRGKKIGKGNVVEEVHFQHVSDSFPTRPSGGAHHCLRQGCRPATSSGSCKRLHCSSEQGDTIKKGQHVAYVEQLGTFVPVEVGLDEAA